MAEPAYGGNYELGYGTCFYYASDCCQIPCINFIVFTQQPGPSNHRNITQAKIDVQPHKIDQIPYPRCNSNSSAPSTTSTHNTG